MMDGLAMLFWMGVLGLAAIVIATVVEWRRTARAERGEWQHMARLSSMRDRAREDRRHAGANASKSVQSP